MTYDTQEPLHPELLQQAQKFNFQQFADVVRPLLTSHAVELPESEAVAGQLASLEKLETPLTDTKEEFTANAQSRIVAKTPGASLIYADQPLIDREAETERETTLFDRAQTAFLQKLTNEVTAITATGPLRPIGVLKKLGMHLTHGGTKELELSRATENDIRKRKAEKGLTNLATLLAELRSAPGALLAKTIAEEDLRRAAKEAQQVAPMLQPRHFTFVTPERSASSQPKERAKRVAPHAGTQAVAGSQASDSTQTSQKPEAVKVVKERVEDRAISEFLTLDFPWMEEGHNVFRPKRYADTNDVLVVTALRTNLAVLASRLQGESPSNADGRDKYQADIHELAKKISSDIMPYRTTNGMVSVNIKDQDRKPEYVGVPIWFTFDKSPNAPRIYYTLKRTGEITEEGREQFLLVILGITDMQNQEEFFKTISTKSLRQLRREGVGAV
jgi:hypothetical protein